MEIIPREFAVVAAWRNDGQADLCLMCEVEGCRWYTEWDADSVPGASATLPELVSAANAHKADRHDDTPMTSSLSP